jgi:hypothetical protein
MSTGSTSKAVAAEPAESKPDPRVEADRGLNAQTGEWVGPPALTDEQHPFYDPRGESVPGVTQPEQAVPDPEQVPLETEVERHAVTATSDVFTKAEDL